MAGNNIQELTNNPQSTKSALFWLNLISIQALLFIVWLLSIPKEAGNAIFFGYSLKRLVLLVPLLLPAISVILLKRRLKKNPDKQFWSTDAGKKSKLAVIMTACGLLIAVTMLSAGFLYHFMAVPIDINIYIRLLPIITCYFLLGLEAVLFVPLVLYPSKQSHQEISHSFPWLPFCIAFGVLVAGLLIVALTGLGINPVRVSIISLGSPLLEGQIWYVTILLALLLIAAYAWKCIPEGSRPVIHGNIDLTIALILWLLAVVLWMSLPLPKNNYFAPQVQAPNFEKYPFSDAEQYDFNSLYVFYGTLKDFVISKPLYVSLLALFHAIAGLSYDRVIFLQTLLVALFPSMLYLIGKELHSRMGGIAIALFAIMREVTAIQATSIANISSTKLLLSDMPATLLASVLALMLIRWFKSNEKKISGHEFIIGGLVGMFILMRIQTIALIPFVLLLAVVRYFRNFKAILTSVLILLFAVGLVVTPILIRNHAITGVYWIDNPSSSSGLSRIMTEGLEVEEEIPIVTESDKPVQNNIGIVGFLIKNNLSGLLGSMADNFIRNEISTILILPVRLGNHITFREYLTQGNPFFAEVYTQPNFLNLLVFLINFAVVALGFAMAFRKYPLAVLVIIGFQIVYSMSSAVVRLSGWRFILPVDWMIYLFYALGLLEALFWLFKKVVGWNLNHHISGREESMTDKKMIFRNGGTIALTIMVFISIGGAIPLREKLLPPLKQDFTKTDICNKVNTQLGSSDFKLIPEGFSEFCMSEKTETFYGTGIYPRLFSAGEGFYDRKNDPWFGIQDYGRLVFRLIGTKNAKIFIKTNNGVIKFKNGDKVYVVTGSDLTNGAVIVLVEGKETQLIISTDLFLNGYQIFE